MKVNERIDILEGTTDTFELNIDDTSTSLLEVTNGLLSDFEMFSEQDTAGASPASSTTDWGN